jgi:hypothetical protein
VGVVSQLSLVAPPEELLLLLPPDEELLLLLELPPLPLELPPPEPDELELELDEPLPPELLLPEGPVSPPGGAVELAQPAYKNPTMSEESE